jgi:hypothetical protein
MIDRQRGGGRGEILHEASRGDSLRGKNNRGERDFVERLFEERGAPGRNFAQFKR